MTRLLPAAILVLAVALTASVAMTEEVDEKAQAAELILLLKSKDSSVRVRALEQAKLNQHSSLTSPLARLVSDKELGVRLGAIEALAARTEEKARRKAASTLASRLKRLSKTRGDQDELHLLIESLGMLGEAVGIKPLIDPIEVEMDMDEVKLRLQAVANVPHEQAVEALIDFLAKGRRNGRGPHRREAHNALRHLTGGNPQDHRNSGKDADRWRAWWKDNKKTIDLEAVAEARHAAAAEKAAKAERKKKKREDAKRKSEERKKKRKEEGEKRKPKREKPPVID